MTIVALDLYRIAVPLKQKIRHASHERTDSENIVARVTLDDGRTGHGEGVPRTYVTGESVESTLAMLSGVDIARVIGSPSTFADVVAKLGAWVLPENEADPRGMAGNAGRSALELAVLDAYGRRHGASLADAIRLAGVPGLTLRDRPVAVRYSGAITAASPRKERISAWKMRVYGFHQVKIKVGVPGQDDVGRLSTFRRILGRRMDLRLDANEAWPADGLVERVRPLLAFGPTALEQPVQHAEVDALAEIRPRLGIPLMLDESLCGYPDAVRAVERKTADILNVRVSKCGGLLGSLKIMGLARRSGLGLQLGCHPGETGLLSAAGRQIAGLVTGLSYVEGSYDRHVLSQNLTREDITFGYGGRARPLSGPGLGVTVDPEALDRLTLERKTVRYD